MMRASLLSVIANTTTHEECTGKLLRIIHPSQPYAGVRCSHLTMQDSFAIGGYLLLHESLLSITVGVLHRVQLVHQPRLLVGASGTSCAGASRASTVATGAI